MLFWIEIDGERVAVQAVNRKPKPYWRLAPYTIVYPTPKQRMVRNTLSIGAHKAVDGTMEDINLEVQASFRNWNYAQRPANRTYEALKELYGDQVDDVMRYIQTRKRAEKKLRIPVYREKIQQAVELQLVSA